MRVPRAVSLAVIATALAGCAVGPDYVWPDQHLASRFNGQAAVEGRGAAQGADLAAWWLGFHDPVLTRLVNEALDKNLDVAQALARVTQARAGLRAANAALAPSAGAQVSGARARQSVETPFGQLLNASPDYDREGELYEADLVGSWEIDVFGGLRRDRQASVAAYQASAAGVDAARLTVTAQTADTYVTLRGLQARIAIARQQVVTQQQLVDTVELQYKAGVAAELQLSQAQGALAQVQATVPVLESAEDSALNAIDILLGAQPGTHRAALTQPSPIPAAPAIADAGGPAGLIRRRPDLVIAERRLAASSAGIGSAMSEYYPRFSLSGLLGTATTTAGNEFNGGANQSLLALGLRWRLFDFGRIDADIAAARGRNAEALAAYRLAVLRASADVEDAFSELVHREQEEVTLARGETSLSRAKTASLAAYKGGVVSLIEVLDADRRLQDTRDARAQAQTQIARAAIASFKALGGGWGRTAETVAVATP